MHEIGLEKMMREASVVGLIITESSLRAVQLSKRNSRRPLVAACGEVAIPPGVARDSEIVDRDAIVLALKELWAEAGFTTKKVALGVGNRRLIVRDYSAPKLSLSQIKRSLPFQVGGFLPIPVEQVILDFQPLRETGTPDGEGSVEGLLVAVMADIVEDLVSAIKAARLQVDSVDMLAFGLTRAVTRVVSRKAPYVAINVGTNSTNIVVISGKTPLFVRVIPMGGSNIEAVLAETFGIDRRSVKNVRIRGSLADLPPEDLARLERVRESVVDLVARIRSTIDYYNERERGSAPVRGIVLSGSSARIPLFAETVMEMMGQSVEFLDPFAGLAMSRNVRETFAEEESIRFTMPLGLVLEGE